MTGNRKCLLPWEEVSSRTESLLPLLVRSCQSDVFLSDIKKGAFSGTSRGYKVFLRFLSSLWESQHCCCTLGVCFLLVFCQTCGGKKKRGWRRGLGGKTITKKKTSINLQKNSSQVRLTAGRAGIMMFEGQGQKKQRAPFELFVFWCIYCEARALHLVFFSGSAPKKVRYHVLPTIIASKMVFFQHGRPAVGDRPCRPQGATCTHTVDVRKLTLRYSLYFPSLSSSVPLPGTMTHKGRQFKSVSFPRDFPHLDNVIHNHAAVWSWGEIKARILNVLQRVMVSVFHVAHILAAVWELHPKKNK